MIFSKLSKSFNKQPISNVYLLRSLCVFFSSVLISIKNICLWILRIDMNFLLILIFLAPLFSNFKLPNCLFVYDFISDRATATAQKISTFKFFFQHVIYLILGIITVLLLLNGGNLVQNNTPHVDWFDIHQKHFVIVIFHHWKEIIKRFVKNKVKPDLVRKWMWRWIYKLSIEAKQKKTVENIVCSM